jgi:hypothetical protein
MAFFKRVKSVVYVSISDCICIASYFAYLSISCVEDIKIKRIALNGFHDLQASRVKSY